jgi:F-type H+-transporting ATPase subunit b
MWIWQVANLVLFFAVLLYFIARPMAQAFAARQREIEERRLEAEKQKAEVERLSADIRERTARLEREIVEIRKQGLADGESAQAALAARAKEEAERIGKGAGEEIERHLTAAKAELQRAASDLTAAAATDILSRELTADDRRRLLTESVERMKAAR